MVQPYTYAQGYEVEAVSRPFMTPIKQFTENVNVFSGIDKRARIPEGKFSDMENMSSHKYPLLSTRNKRHIVEVGSADKGDIAGMISKEKMCYVRGSGVIMGGGWIDMGLNPTANHTLVSFGSYIIILPEKKYINYADTSDQGDIEAVFYSKDTATSNYPFAITPCDITGTDYTNVTISDTAPTEPENGAYWLDTSGDVNVMKQYSEYSLSWVSLVSSYIKITRVGLAEKFEVGDAVTISGFPINSGYYSLNGTYVIQAKNETQGWIVIPGTLEKSGEYEPGGNVMIEIRRAMPTMDFVIESGNRLWGCRYGEVDGKRVNEIYASKLGDFKNWNVFEGTSMDSYVATVGTDGKFTGAVSYRGTPYFFKENVVHKIYGSYPSQFQVQTSDIEGVGDKCGKSIAVIDNVMFYKSRNGVCMYDGSFPADIGAPLGTGRYEGVIGGNADGKYYLYMDFSLYCYDATNGIWSREKSPQITHMEDHEGVLHFTDGETVYTVNGSAGTVEDDFDWFVETGEIGVDSNAKKYINRLIIRARLPMGSRMRVLASYDGSDSMEILYDASDGTNGVSDISVRPKRCDRIKLRIEGHGECEIYSITKYLSYGSTR